MTIETELVQTFGPKVDQPELIQACEQLMKIFALSVEDLFLDWESFIFAKNNGNDLEITTDSLLRLQHYIQEKLEKKKQHEKEPPSTIKSTRRIIKNVGSSPFNFLPATPSLIKRKKLNETTTPIRKLNAPSLHTNSSPLSVKETPTHNTTDIPTLNVTPTPLKQNTQSSGAVIESLNPHIVSSASFDTLNFEKENPLKLTANFDSKKYAFRTMRTKLLETADVLDSQIEQFMSVLQESLGLTINDFANPSIIQQSQILTVGRIVSDNPALVDELNQLNSSSLALETSRLLGVGKRVPLDLSSLDKFSFFPGQIVALRGKNASGEYFKVDEILEIPLLGAPVTTKEELLEYYSNEGDDNDIKVVIASGPYTTNNELDFKHLEGLIENINNIQKPHLVIFFGPFIDITHPLVATGDIDVTAADGKTKPKTLDDVFKLILTPILKKLNNKIQAVIIPSLKDSTSKHAAYPQDSLDRKSLLLPKNFKTFPNPSIFQINEFVVGVSNNDIFKDLKDVNKGDEFVKLNRFERISSHIIEQRRFYPFFPGATRTRKRNLSESTTEQIVEQLPASELDIPYLGLSEFNETVPDILIIPSELRFFAKIVKNVLVINPGVFMRPNGPGSYVSLSLKAPNYEKLTKVQGQNEELYLHDIWDRAKIDIIKS
jgi:DNA polymerase alpha subunit B